MPALCRVLNAVDAVSTSRYTVGVYDVSSESLRKLVEWRPSATETELEHDSHCPTEACGRGILYACTCVIQMKRRLSACTQYCMGFTMLEAGRTSPRNGH